MNMDLGDTKLKPILMLGEGSFGRVFLCKCQCGKEQCYVCVKRIIVKKPRYELKKIEEEIYIASQLDHPNIPRFKGWYHHAGTINIIMEYVGGGTLRHVINVRREVGHIESELLLKYVIDILMGLEYLRIRNIIHRDIKPENLLISREGNVKITDFGISVVHTPGSVFSNYAGTPRYMAPEILNGAEYEFKSDIWSLGCVIYELYTGRHPFEKALTVDDLKQQQAKLCYPHLKVERLMMAESELWQGLCQCMITYCVKDRLALQNVLVYDRRISLPYYVKYFEHSENDKFKVDLRKLKK